MNDQKVKDSVKHIKDFYTEMPPKKKKTLAIVAGAIVAFAVILTLILNLSHAGYRVLYKNIDSAESTTIYQTLKEMGASPQINSAGEVMVPEVEYDMWLVQLAGKGFPQTALTYDVFSSHSGMTTTESERQQWLIYQLQDRIQSTLKRISGVNNAVVTITLPKDTGYVWEQATNKAQSTAGVLLTLQPGTTLSANQVTAIKNLVAAGTPQMNPEDVTVVDAQTMLELHGEDSTAGITSTQNLQFEQMVQKQIEENIVRVLSPRYGSSGVVAVAKVTINYDKMITERMDLQEKPVDAQGNGGGGYTTHTEGEYDLDKSETIGGIAGEENNTDIPGYEYPTTTDDKNTSHYTWSTDYDYSYIKSQIEKGGAILERATVSVMVNESNLSDARRTELTALVSKCADIEPDLVYVSGFATPVSEEPTTPGASNQSIFELVPLWVFAAAGVSLLVIIILIASMIHKHRAAVEERLIEDEMRKAEEARKKVEEEINAYKRQLTDAAKASVSAKDDAILDDVRDFAKTNPEITASLIRSWLKEDE